MGSDEAAAAAYRAVIEQDPGCAAAHYALGLLYHRKLDQPARAAEHFRRHLELKPEVAIVRTWLEEAESRVLFRLVHARPIRPGGGGVLAVASLTEVKPGKAEAEAGAAAAGEEHKAPAPAPDAISVIAFRGVRGRITAADAGRFEIDAGSAAGVVEGMTFTVTREGRWIGTLQATGVRERSASCAPVAGERTGTGDDAAWAFRAGDEVAQREDVLGAGVADEARMRKQVLALQQEEQKFQQERKELRERERLLVRDYYTKPTLEGMSRFVAGMARLQADDRDLKRRSGEWLDGVLKTREEGVGNRHFATYREELRRQRVVEDQDAAWQEVMLDIRADMAAFYAAKGSGLEKKREAIEARSKTLAEEEERISERAGDRALSRDRNAAYQLNEQYKTFTKKVEALRKDIDAFNQEAEKLNGDLRAFGGRIAEVERARERWQAGDEVYTTLLGRRVRLGNESLANAGRYDLLRGRDARALRTFKLLLASAPEGDLEAQARDGAELAALRLVLRGQNGAEAAGALAPPLRELWSAAAAGRHVGKMRLAGGLLLAFFAVDNPGAAASGRLVAWDAATGRAAWELPFPGLPLGDWILRPQEVVFATTAGALHRVDAASGAPIGRLDLDAAGQGVPERSRLQPAPRGVWWSVRVRNGQERIYGIDFDDPARSGLFLPEGAVAHLAALGDGLVIAERRREAEDKPARTFLALLPWDQLAAPGPLLPVLVDGGNVEWLGVAAGSIVVNTVAEGTDAATHLCFLDPRDVRDASSGWRVSFEGSHPLADVAPAGERLYALFRDGSLLALEPGARRIAWSGALALPNEDEEVRGGAILGAGKDGVSALTGGATPPWNVSAVDSDGLLLAAEYIPDGAAVPRELVDGRLYTAGRDGSLACTGITRSSDWESPPERPDSLLLPSPTAAAALAEQDALLASTAAGEERLAYEALAGTDGPARGAPLLLAGETLFFLTPRDGRLRAYAGSGAR